MRSPVRLWLAAPEKTLVRKNKSFFSYIRLSASDIELCSVIFASQVIFASRVLVANIISLLPTAKYFIICKDYFIWRSHISFSLAPPPLLCYACATIGTKKSATTFLLVVAVLLYFTHILYHKKLKFTSLVIP